MASEGPSIIQPDWPAPAAIRSLVTTRSGGVSTGPWASMNPAAHVGDDPGHVQQNRDRLDSLIGAADQVRWLQQVHGTVVADAAGINGVPEADGSYTSKPEVVCAVLTADCLPVLLCNRAGTEIAAVHCGWRGLAAGIIEQAMKRFSSPADEILSWLGPAIGPNAFEVGEDVREAFNQRARRAGWQQAPGAAFKPVADNKYLADLYLLARLELGAFGVNNVYGGGFCTVADSERFFSYRRDGVCGRMASLVWIAGES